MDNTKPVLPAEPFPGRAETYHQKLFEAVVIVAVVIWPDVIPVVSVLLAVLALDR